jgi:hypothetical protein
VTAFQPDPHEHDGEHDARADATPPTEDVSNVAASGAVVASACPLCGTVVQPTDLRCPSCNMTLAGVGGRPGPFSRGVLWAWALALIAIYLVVLAIVAVVPS